MVPSQSWPPRRRLQRWPRVSPNLAVQGQLGWHDAETTRLIQAAGLWARLSLPVNCFEEHLARHADNIPSSWVSVSVISRTHIAGPTWKHVQL